MSGAFGLWKKLDEESICTAYFGLSKKAKVCRLEEETSQKVGDARCFQNKLSMMLVIICRGGYAVRK